MSSNTVFVLVPGSYSPASLYHKITARLIQHGYHAVESDHPTCVGPNKAKATFEDDVQQVRSLATNLLDEGKNVIIVCNSYGGHVCTEAVKGLSKAERSDGRGLSNLVYFGALLPPAVLTTAELVAGIVHIPMDVEGDLVDAPPPEKAGPMLWKSFPEAEQLRYSKMLVSMAKASHHGRLTHLGYLHVPTTFVVCETDMCLPPKYQHESVDTVIRQGKGNAEVVKRVIQADHCAMCSHPEELTKVLMEVAERSV